MKKIIIISGAVAVGAIILFVIVKPSIEKNKIFEEYSVPETESIVAETGGTSVNINGRELSQEEVDELRQRYGVEPVEGNFWYDSKSGAYGAAGGPALGLMYPGHDFGPLSANASGGTSDVFFNGRELTQNEAESVAGLFGTPVIPGRYWLGAEGNIGIEGSDIPLANLYAALAAYARAGGGAGDNFWTAGVYSGGNYNAGNTQGYVSVPGYGPVDYGF